MAQLGYVLKKMEKLGNVEKNGNFYSVKKGLHILMIGIDRYLTVATISVRSARQDMFEQGVYCDNINQAIRLVS